MSMSASAFSIAAIDDDRISITVSYPFSYSCNVIPRDAEDQIEAALGAARAITNEHGMKFAVCDSSLLSRTGVICRTEPHFFPDGPALRDALQRTRKCRRLDV